MIDGGKQQFPVVWTQWHGMTSWLAKLRSEAITLELAIKLSENNENENFGVPIL